MQTQRATEALGYDQLNVGDGWISPARTVTETDVVNFACLTGDFNPLHVDRLFAANTPFRQPIAHGLLGLSWVAGLTSRSPYVKTAAFVRIVDWTFCKPIFFGDTLHVETEVHSITPQGRGRRAIVQWKRRVINQNGVTVQEGTTETLVDGERRNPHSASTDDHRKSNATDGAAST